MFKLFKYALLGVLMLDAAILPFSCFRTNSDEGELHIWFVPANEESLAGIRIDKYIIQDAKKGDVIDEEYIMEIVGNIVDSKNVKNYQVVKYSLADDSEINMPYTLTEEAIRVYYQGVRGAFNIKVYLDIELYKEGEVNA